MYGVIKSASDGDYTIAVTAYDEAENESTDSVIVTIDNTKPLVEAVLPNDHDTIGGKYIVKANASDENGISEVFATFRDRVTDIFYTKVPMTYNSASGSYEAEVDTKAYPESQYNVRFTARDLVNNQNGDSALFIQLDNTYPVVNESKMYVNGVLSDLGKSGDTIRIDAYITDEHSSVEKVKIWVREFPWDPNKNELISGSMTHVESDLWTYEFTIPSTYKDGDPINELFEGNYYDFKTWDSVGNSKRGWRDNFTVDNTAPIVNIDNPLDGAYLNRKIEIVGDIIEPNLLRYFLTVKDLTKTHYSSGVVYTDGPLVDYKFGEWNSENAPEGKYTVMLEARDKLMQKSAGSVDTAVITIDRTGPVSEFTFPEDGFRTNLPIDISGITNDNFAVSKVFLYYSPSGQGNWILLSEEDGFGSASFSWEYLGWTPSDGVYDLTVVAVDLAGNVESTDFVRGVTFDTTAPSSSCYGSYL
jgi:hypothetical protein